MKYTLPLKQKQIEQSRLEAAAQKETTVKNAEAQAQAKVIDSKAEMERRGMLAEAEANRIRIVAVADSERMKSEAALLKESPLLINKIVAERMSDKLQIMMVPSDAKIFFNDIMKSGVTPEAFTNAKAAQAAAEESEGSDQDQDEQPAPAQQATRNKTWKGQISFCRDSPGCLFPPEQAARAGGKIILPRRHGGRSQGEKPKNHLPCK